ncbi:MAG: DUF2510 domain-containing protein [Fuerstiella sp.]|nr:DUF2510 domain-containing protein [Fuerstiella sp.]
MTIENTEATVEAGPFDQDERNDAAPEFQRVCRQCSAQTTTSELHCPACGASYVKKSVLTKNRIVIGAVALAAVLVGIVGLVGFNIYQERQEEEAAAAAAEAERRAAEQAAEEREAAQEAARFQRTMTVSEIESSITKMAKGHVSDGVLSGPILNSQCSPVAGGSLDDLTEQTTKFSCLAVNEKLTGGRVRGYTYHAVMNWDTGKYTYGLGDS